MSRWWSFVLFIGIVFLTASCNKQNEPNNRADNSVAQENNIVEAFGTVKANYIKNISIDFPAFIRKINVKDGEKAKAEDVLVELDINDFKTQIENKEHELNIEKMELEVLQNSIHAEKKELERLEKELATKKLEFENSTDSDIKRAINDIKNAEDLYSKALKDLDIKTQLYNEGCIARHELDEFKKYVDEKDKQVKDTVLALGSLRKLKQKELDQLQTLVEQKEAQLKGNTSNDVIRVGIRKEKIALLESECKAMKDKLNKSYLKEKYIVCNIPNGLVYDIGYEEGDQIVLGLQPKKVLSIMDLKSILVQADVPEEFIKEVRTGADVLIIPEADKSRQYKGKILKIYDKAVEENGETNIKVDISIENPDGLLRPGCNVDVSIKTN